MSAVASLLDPLWFLLDVLSHACDFGLQPVDLCLLRRGSLGEGFLAVVQLRDIEDFAGCDVVFAFELLLALALD